MHSEVEALHGTVMYVFSQINTQKLQKLSPFKDFTLYREFISFKNIFIYPSWWGLFFPSFPQGVLHVQPVFHAWSECLSCFRWPWLLHTPTFQPKNLVKPYVIFWQAIMFTKNWSDAFFLCQGWVILTAFLLYQLGCFHIGATLFPICSSLLPVLKNGRCGEKESSIKSTLSFTCHSLENQVDEPSLFSAKVRVVIWGEVINVLVTTGNPDTAEICLVLSACI